MPELPEVETIIRRLRDGSQNQLPVPGQTIQSVEVTWNRIIAVPTPEAFKKFLPDKKIVDARRRGKFLHFPLSEGHLIAHLRMSGDMRMEPRFTPSGTPCPSEAFDRVTLNFESGWRLAFSNIRKFGRMWAAHDAQDVFGSLGPEPLSQDFTADRLARMVHEHSRQIKPLLMDQKFIAGLGNIYTDEILFKAKIHPLRKSDSLSLNETERLHKAIQLILKEGIRRAGASLDWVYRGGDFQNYFKVYQQTGESCPNCGTIIEKMLVGQRGTHFCPSCQKLPPPA